MNDNVKEKYHLTDGYAIIDNNFCVVSANENFYRFVGIARYYTLMDYIHQVDLNDFIEVSNSLRINTSKSMVIRMRRVDNSYRWILVDVRRCELEHYNTDGTEREAYEYLELKLNDIQAMQRQNMKLKQTINEYSRLLALEGELIFTVDCVTQEIVLYRFVDEEMSVLFVKTLSEFETDLRKNGFVPDSDIDVCERLYRDLRRGTSKFLHKLHFSIEGNKETVEHIEVKGVTNYVDDKPSKILGTMRRLDSKEGFTKNLIDHGAHHTVLSKKEVLDYFHDNIIFNANGEMMLMLLEVDGLQQLTIQYGQEFTDSLINNIVSMAKEKVSYRGIVGIDKDNVFYLAVKGLNLEVNARAFIESLRSMITWQYKVMNEAYNITFSIGIARYPFNGRNYDRLVLKAQKALELAISKGRNRFILYKEILHGEIGG